MVSVGREGEGVDLSSTRQVLEPGHDQGAWDDFQEAGAHNLVAKVPRHKKIN